MKDALLLALSLQAVDSESKKATLAVLSPWRAFARN